MLQVLGGGVEVLRERLIQDTTIIGIKIITLDPPVESLDRTIYVPQFIWAGGYPGSTPWLGSNIRWELTARNNFQVVNAGDPAGLYPFACKIIEVNRDLAIQMVTASITYSPTPSINDIAINPVPDIARALVIPLYEWQDQYDRPGYASYYLTSKSNLRVVAYQYGGTATGVVAKFLIVNLF